MNAMSLKARIRNIAKDKNIPAQVILQNYMFERLLLRLSQSQYKDKFVLKGGMLVAAIVGLDNRATMDLDATLKNIPLNESEIIKALTEIIDTKIDDNVSFNIETISPIREDDIYGGYRVSINARYDTIITPLSFDISTGDVITPNPIRFAFTEIFDENKRFELYAYNIESVLAEKIETILRRSVFNTRPRDFYDAYILLTTQPFDKEVFYSALRATSEHRGTTDQIANTEIILSNLAESRNLQVMWDKYRKQFVYAKDIEYSDIIKVLNSILN